MSTNITGRDPAAATWPLVSLPIVKETWPSNEAIVGAGTTSAALADASDATYVQGGAGTYWNIRCNPIVIPANARISSCYATIRARVPIANTRQRDFVLGIGDHSSTGGVRKNLTVLHRNLTGSTGSYNTGSTNSNSKGQLLSAADIQKGMYIVFGLNAVYGTLTNSCLVSSAQLKYQYDLPPTATVTYPPNAGTLNDTAAPIFAWDYFDDLQPQAKFRLQVLSGSTVVHDSGIVTSSDTSYQLPLNLANGTYTTKLRVYQRWNGPGGDFPALVDATNTFTIAVLGLSSPRLDIITLPRAEEYGTIAVYPDLNLLGFDNSTGDRGVLGLLGPGVPPNGCTLDRVTTPIRDGVASIKITTTATSGNFSTKFLEVAALPGQAFNGMAYVNPLTVTGATAQYAIEWMNSAGAIISEVVGSSVALTINTWNQITITNAIAPANTVGVVVRVKWTVTTIGQILYADDLGVWYANGVVRHNLSINPNFETSIANWAANGPHPPTLSQDATQFHSGTKSLKAVFPGTIAFGDGFKQTLTSLVVGQKTTATGWVRLVSGAPSNLVISVDNSSDVISGSVALGFDVWERLSITFTPNSTTVTFFFSYWGPSNNSAFTVFLDDFMVEPTDVVNDYFDGSTAGATWDGTANLSSSTLIASLVPWSRGGFFESTPNQLSYADSTIEDDSFIWQTDTVGAPNTVVTRDNTNFAHGAAFSLMLNISTGTGTISAILGSGYYIPVTGVTTLRGLFSIFSGTSRTVQMVIKWFKADFSASTTPTTTWATTSTTGAWKYNVSNSVAVPADAAYYQVYLQALLVAGSTEKHWFDGITLLHDSNYQGFWSGYYDSADTDQSPTLLVEYQNFLETEWKVFDNIILTPSMAQVTLNDYSLASGLGRRYRATLLQRERGITLNSDPSAASSYVTKTFSGVWLNSDVDPAGTSYQFIWDGGGRTEVIDTQPSLVEVDGRDYPFAQFGEHYAGTVDVSIMMETQNDVVAMHNFAKSKTIKVYRDGRGRSYRGVMGPVSLEDIKDPNRKLKRATFTFQLAGIQP